MSTSGKTHAIGVAAVMVLAALVYANSVGNELVFDDRLMVRDHPTNVFLSSYHGDSLGWATGLYRPLTVLSFAWNYRWAGVEPASYHAVNVVLHAGISALVLLLALRSGLRRGPALAAGMLFAAHPVHTEAVAYVSGRADLLATALFLAGILAWAGTGLLERRAQRLMLVLATACFLLAAFSKEIALTFVAVALAWDLLLLPDAGEPIRPFLARSWRKLVAKQSALAGALAAYFVLRVVALGELFPGAISPDDNPLVASGLFERWATAAVVAVRSLVLLVFPASLSPDYSHAQIEPVGSPTGLEFLVSGAVLVAVVAALGAAIGRAREVAWAGLFSIATYMITSNFIVPIGTIMAERLLYLPSVGFCLLLGHAVARMSSSLGARPVRAAVAILLVVASWRTVERNSDWHDDLTLFSKAAETVPRSVKVRNNFGMALLKRGRTEEAREQFGAGLSIDPDYHTARVNLAQSFLTDGSADEAERELRAVLAAAPGHGEASTVLTGLLIADTRLEEAESILREVIDREPEAALAHARLGAVLAARGELEPAVTALERAVELEPDLVLAWNDLGLIAGEAGRPDEAVDRFREAVRRDPGSVELRNNLADALRRAGRPGEAVAELESAIAVNADFAPTHFNLGLALEDLGRLDEAAERFGAATELRPDHDGAWRALARARLALGDEDGAIEAYRRVVELAPDSVAARNNLGVILAGRGDLEGARREWEEALRLAPDSAEIRENLEILDGMSGH